jgi:mRNA interferase YafQ
MFLYHETTRFRKDLKRVLAQGKDYGKLRAVIAALLDEEELDPKLRDHPLHGDWEGSRELHLQPDWLLIYRVESEVLILERTGSHAELFGK